MMERISLVLPQEEHEVQALALVQEHIREGTRNIHGSSGLSFAESYGAWLEQTRKNMNLETCAANRVPATTYFVIREGNGTIVGTIQIRHELNAALLQTGGHIGYGVRPSERRKGYATRMLALALEKCRELGIDRALITCNQGNEASRKVILKNGGTYENSAVEENGTVIERYWIEL